MVSLNKSVVITLSLSLAHRHKITQSCSSIPVVNNNNEIGLGCSTCLFVTKLVHKVNQKTTFLYNLNTLCVHPYRCRS